MTAPLILGTNSIKDTGFDVANSIRFNSGDSAFMTKTSTTVTNDKKFTVSAWCKRSKLGSSSEFGIFKTISDSNNQNKNIQFGFYHDSIYFAFVDGGSVTVNKVSTAVFRDSSAWYHVMLAVDSTQGTAANRNRIYVNGTEVTSFSTDTNAGADETFLSTSCNIDVGRYTGTSGTHRYFDGYLAEVVFIDGLQLAPTDFGEFDSDSPRIWKPKDPSSLTFGNNGFYLDFKDSSNLGNDANGGTDLTESNIVAIDQCTDTCTNNFATFTSENHTYSGFTVSEGNLKVVTTSGQKGLHGTSIMPTDSGKWYFEVKIDDGAPGDGSRVGIMNYQTQLNNSSYTGVINTPSQVLAGCTTSCKSAKHFEGDAQGVMVEYTSSGDFADGDIVQFAMDLDNKAIYIGRNGTFLSRTGSSGGDPTSGSSKTGAITTNTNIMDGSPMTAYTGISIGGGGSADHEMSFNFGNPPFSISSGNTDTNGFGNFEHAVPSGYLAWCSKNLAESG